MDGSKEFIAHGSNILDELIDLVSSWVTIPPLETLLHRSQDKIICNPLPFCFNNASYRNQSILLLCILVLPTVWTPVMSGRAGNVFINHLTLGNWANYSYP